MAHERESQPEFSNPAQAGQPKFSRRNFLRTQGRDLANVAAGTALGAIIGREHGKKETGAEKEKARNKNPRNDTSCHRYCR